MLKLYDDQSDPNLSVRLFTRLVTSDKVNFLLGPYSSGITIPASSVSEKYEVPMVQGGGASGKIFDRGYKYIFGTLPKAEFYFQAAIEAAAKREPRVQTAALLVSADNREQGDPDLLRFCGAGAVTLQLRENYAVLMRVAMLSSLQANDTTNNLGFRCARSLP